MIGKGVHHRGQTNSTGWSCDEDADGGQFSISIHTLLSAIQASEATMRKPGDHHPGVPFSRHQRRCDDRGCRSERSQQRHCVHLYLYK
jgi:hypothetical protein